MTLIQILKNSQRIVGHHKVVIYYCNDILYVGHIDSNYTVVLNIKVIINT